MLRYYVLTTLSCAVIFTLLIAAINRCNLKKKKRPLQIFSFTVLSVGVLYSMLFLSKIINLIDSFLQLGFVRKVSTFLFGAVKPVALVGTVLAILLLNLLFLLAGWLVKGSCNLVLRFLHIPEGRFNPFAFIIRGFYDTEIGCFTRSHTIVYRKWLLWAKYCVLFIFALMNLGLLTIVFYYPAFLGDSTELIKNVLIYLYWVPVVSYLLLNEAYYFLKGVDIDDEDYDFETEAMSSVIVGSYARMVEVYTEMASKANLIKVYSYYNSFRDRMFNGGKSSHNTLCEPELRPVYDMIENNIRITGVDICDEYANALVSMLNRKDVFLSDSIIGEVSQYLFNYLNYQLCCRHRVLILCRPEIYDDKKRLELYIGMIKKNFKSINGYGTIWQVGTYDNILKGQHIDVLVSSFSSFIFEYSHCAENDFYTNISTCVCADCLELFSDEQIYKKAIFSLLEHQKKKVQYIFLTENNSEMLKSAVKDILGKSHHIDFYKNSNRLKDVYVFLWRDEGYYKPQMIFDTESKYYYGSALPLGIIAAKYGVEKVNIINCEHLPYRVYHNAMKDRTADIEKAIFRSVDLDNFFTYEFINYYISNDLVFLIVYDRYNNAALCKDVWGKIADNKTKILHIISEPYMLREFLCDRIDNTQIAEAIVPFNDVSFRKSVAEATIISMFEFGVKLSGLKSIRTALKGDQTISVTEMLRELFVLSFPEESEDICNSSFAFEDDIRFVCGEGQNQDHYDTDRVVRFNNKELYETLISKDEYAKVFLNSKDDWRWLPILKSDIHNYYLEDQHISIDGESVLISEIRDGNIWGKFDSETNHYDYVPVVSFSSTNFNVIDDDNDEDAAYYIRYGTSDVTRVISDYYSMLHGRNLKDSTNCRKYFMSEAEEVTNSIAGVKTLEIRLNYDFSDNTHAAVLFAELLNGLFRTLFPTLYQNIVACANTTSLRKDEQSDSSEIASEKDPEKDAEKGSENGTERTEAQAQDSIIDMIPCDNTAPSDACVVTVYEFCHKEIGLVYELKTRFMDIMLLLKQYLDWETSYERDDSAETTQSEILPEDTSVKYKKESYLKYGFDQYPEIFPVEEFKQYLEAVIPHNISRTKYNTNIHLSEWAHCDYCFRPILLTAHRMSDYRLMCNDCFDCCITQKKEIEDLFINTVKFLENHYLEEIVRKAPDGTLTISVRFKSRKTINKKIKNKSPVSVVLGFYNADRRRLWVERGGPMVAIFAILAHELTHAWQNDTFDMKAPSSLVNKTVQLEGIEKPVHIKDIHVWEGQATYVEIEVMRLNNQHAYADYLESEILCRSDDDVYKIGYLYMIKLLRESNSDNIFRLLREEENRVE